MTSYTPNPTVTFDGGLTYTDNTIASISINAGRNNVLEQPQPSYANIQLWTDANNPIPVNLSEQVQVSIDSSLYGEPTRTNLITNPSFETNTTGYNNADCTLARITTASYIGTASMSVTATTLGTGPRVANEPNVTANVGLPYIASVYVYNFAGNNREHRLDLRFFNAANALISTIVGTVTTINVGGGWTRLSTTGVAPANTASVDLVLFIQLNNPSLSNVTYLDAVMIEQSSTLNDYFDGSSTSPLGAAWTGTANASTSTLTGIKTPIFTGIISDIEISLDGYGEIGSIARYSITAVGSLAQLNKRLVGQGGFAKEFDGTRVFNILAEAFLTNWLDVNPTLTWAQLPTDVTWDSYDATNINLVNALSTTITQPGDYELTDYAAAETNAYELAQLAAQSGRGVLWEGNDGHLHYDAYLTRLGYETLTLTADDILARGLKTAAQWSEIVNDVKLTYKTGLEVTSREEQSVILYGQLSGTRTTQLHNLTDAQNQADSFKISRSYPRVYPEIITSPLHSPTITDATRDSLASVYCGLPITTDQLPAVFGTFFTGYVEGWQWNLTRYTAELALICSAEFETYTHLTWFQIPVTTTWAGYTPNTDTWQDL